MEASIVAMQGQIGSIQNQIATFQQEIANMNIATVKQESEYYEHEHSSLHSQRRRRNSEIEIICGQHWKFGSGNCEQSKPDRGTIEGATCITRRMEEQADIIVQVDPIFEGSDRWQSISSMEQKIQERIRSSEAQVQGGHRVVGDSEGEEGDGSEG